MNALNNISYEFEMQVKNWAYPISQLTAALESHSDMDFTVTFSGKLYIPQFRNQILWRPHLDDQTTIGATANQRKFNVGITGHVTRGSLSRGVLRQGYPSDRDTPHGNRACSHGVAVIIQFSLNFFTKFREFSDKNICHYSKRFWTGHLLC